MLSRVLECAKEYGGCALPRLKSSSRFVRWTLHKSSFRKGIPVKRLMFAVFGTIIAIGMCGVAWSQDADEDPEHEKLKVLEPLIGTYYAEWSEEDGEQDTLM